MEDVFQEFNIFKLKGNLLKFVTLRHGDNQKTVVLIFVLFLFFYLEIFCGFVTL